MQRTRLLFGESVYKLLLANEPMMGISESVGRSSIAMYILFDALLIQFLIFSEVLKIKLP